MRLVRSTYQRKRGDLLSFHRSGCTMPQGCTSGYHVVGTTKCGTTGTATCSYSCHGSCGTGDSCVNENQASSCTKCFNDKYTFTAARGQTYGTCTHKLGVITLTQAVTVDSSYHSVAQIAGNKKIGFEVAYGVHLGIWGGSASAISGVYKTGCSVTATVAARRSNVVVSYKAVVSALLSSGAYTAARTLTKTQFMNVINALRGSAGLNALTVAKILSLGSVGIKWSSASTTGITGFLSLLVAAWCWT